MDDKDLQAQFEDLFSGITPEPSEEPAAERDTSLEDLISTLLEGAPGPAVPAAGSAAPASVRPRATEEAVTAEALVAELITPPVTEEVIPAMLEEAVTAEATVEPVAPPVVEEVAPVAPPAVAPAAVAALAMQPETAVEPVAPPIAEEVAPVAPPAVAPTAVAAPVTQPEAAVEKPVVMPLIRETGEIPVPQPKAAEEKPRFAPPAVPAWDVRIREQRARILNTLLGATAGVATLIILSLVFFSLRQPDLWRRYIPYFVAWVVLVTLALARRLDPRWRTGILVGLAYLAGTLSLWIDGPLSAGWLYLLLVPLLFSILVRPRAGLYAAVASFAIYLAMAVVHHLGWLQPAGVLDITQWSTVLNLSATFGLLLIVATLLQWLFTSTLFTALHEAEERHADALYAQTLLRERADELFATNTLLQKRALQLQAAAQVSSVAALAALDPDELVQQVVNVIHERLGLRYVGLFLTEETGEQARLRAAAGEAGQQMLARGYGIAVGPDSVLGRCMMHAEAIIAGEVQPISFAEPFASESAHLLSDTRAEIALPLRSRGRVIGALDLRDTRPDAFSEDDVPVLQTMADQIAVAIDNAQLFAKTQASLRELEEAQRWYVRERWSEFVSGRTIPVYERTQPNVMPIADAVPPEVEQAMTRREIVVQPSTDGGQGQAALVAPIVLRGEVIGVLGLHDMQEGRQWTADEIALVQTIADQMSLALENARLLEETQQRAERERLIAEITTRVRASMDVESIMRAAVRELGAVLGADRAFIRLGSGGVQPSIAQAERIYGDRDER